MPRVPPFDRPATYDDLVTLPDTLVAEIIDGEFHASPRPAIEVLRLENGRWSILEVCVGAAIVRIEPFNGVALDVAALWAG